MKGKLLRKLCAVSLSALMLVGGGAVGVVPFVSTGLSVSAATTADGKFEYEVNEDGGVTITKYTGNDTEVVIPSKIGGKKVTSIGDYAFKYCESLTSVTIPDSVTSIGEYAFSYCESLTSVTIPNSVTSIGNWAFYNCHSLTSVTIPDSVTSIGGGAFFGCSSLTSVTIPNSVTSIGDSAFYRCSSLTSVTIPDSVTSIGDDAFSNCSSLTSVTIPDSVTSIGYGAFRGCEGLADEKGFVIVKDVLYDYDGNDTQVTIPDSVTSIGYGAFEDCSSLTSVTIPDSVTSIGDDTFSGCSSLTSVTIPTSVTSIGDYAFSFCSNLSSVTIPTSVKCIGDGAFLGCKNLADENGFVIIRGVLYEYYGNDTNVTIPNGVTSIGTMAFSFCTGIISVHIPNSVTSIGEEAFANCKKLTSVTIPDSVTNIGDKAFESCYSLTSVTIPDSVISIGYGAFQFCSGLTSVMISDSTNTIGDSAFRGCTNLADQDGFIIVKNVLYGYYGNDTDIRIPDNVMSIGGSAFWRCTNLTSVYITDSVESINSEAFCYCTNLTTVIIPESVTNIGNKAFFNCKSLTIKGKTGSYAQSYAANNGIPFEEDGDEENCDYEYTVNQDGGVTITKYKGSDTDVVIPDIIEGKKVTNIGDKAFESCYSLTSVTIPDSVTSIGYGAFSYCTHLTAVTIPDNITSIGDRVFYGTYELTIKGKAGSYAETYAKNHIIPFEVLPLDNLSALSVNEVVLGKSVTVNCVAAGGTGDYTYAVWYKRSSDSSWTTKQNYSTNATIKIKPASAEKYDISVKVKDSSGTIVKKAFTVNVFAPLKNTTTVSSTSIGYGGTFTVKAKATGGLGDYTYAVYYKKASATKWTTAQNYSSTKTVTIKPKYAEEYDVSVKVKDSRGVVAKKTFKIKVTKPTNTSKVASTTITLGNTIDITCSATGGSGFYQYAVYYKKSSDTSWKTKQSYSSNTNVSIKPASKTKYDVSVKVKDGLGNVSKKAFTITVK